MSIFLKSIITSIPAFISFLTEFANPDGEEVKRKDKKALFALTLAVLIIGFLITTSISLLDSEKKSKEAATKVAKELRETKDELYRVEESLTEIKLVKRTQAGLLETCNGSLTQLRVDTTINDRLHGVKVAALEKEIKALETALRSSSASNSELRDKLANALNDEIEISDALVNITEGAQL